MEKKTRISVLRDALPGYDAAGGDSLLAMLAEAGFDAAPLTVERFAASKNVFAEAGYLLIVPSADSMPLELITPLKNYTERGGRLLTLGGPIFYYNIRRVGESYEKLPLPDAPGGSMYIDATFLPDTPDFVLEGFTPSYKTYETSFDGPLTSDAAQNVWSGTLAGRAGRRVLCPSARPRGDGFARDRHNRFIPIVNAGDRGAAAFIMLNGLRGAPRMTGYPHSERPGFVKNTAFGGAAAGVGLPVSELLALDGGAKLLLSLVRSLLRGVYLFEGGCSEYRVRDGGDVTLGARVLNAGLYFAETTVRFTLSGDGGTRRVFERPLLAAPYNLTEVSFRLKEPLWPGKYTVRTELLLGGEVIDEIKQEFSRDTPRVPSPDDFVRVENGAFTLGGKPFTVKGINYWPHFFPSFENVDYWCGWLDKSFYSPADLELDLRRMKKYDINCLFTRLDGYEHSRVGDSLRDFLARCGEHGFKVMLSYPNVTSPADYCDAAFAQLIEENSLDTNTALFAHDISWEVGSQYGGQRALWDGEWERWLCDRYGSPERAEADWGVPLDRLPDGSPTSPPSGQFADDGPHRAKTAAYRRFLDCLTDRYWGRAVDSMKKHDPNHLYTYRQGSLGILDVAYTGTHRHTDFLCPEGYHIPSTREGYDGACFSTVCLKALSGGQPVVWAEFGWSPCGTQWSKLFWDHENRAFLPGKQEHQTEYMALIHRMLVDSGADGAAPWWWCGGFRMAEMADFGYMGPDGTPRPCLEDYAETLKKLETSRKTSGAEIAATAIAVTVDRENPRGLYGECMEKHASAWRTAAESGKTLRVLVAGAEFTSGSCPAEAVGGLPYTGHNPHRWLDAAIDRVTVGGAEVSDGGTASVDGDSVKLELALGNIGDASWLPAGVRGGVSVVSADGGAVRIPLTAPVGRLGSLTVSAVLPLSPGENRFALTLEAEGVGRFGDVYKFIIVRK